MSMYVFPPRYDINAPEVMGKWVIFEGRQTSDIDGPVVHYLVGLYGGVIMGSAKITGMFIVEKPLHPRPVDPWREIPPTDKWLSRTDPRGSGALMMPTPRSRFCYEHKSSGLTYFLSPLPAELAAECQRRLDLLYS